MVTGLDLEASVKRWLLIAAVIAALVAALAFAAIYAMNAGVQIYRDRIITG